MDLSYRELLVQAPPHERQLKRLEWRWLRSLVRWEAAAIKVQSQYRGRMARKRVVKLKVAANLGQRAVKAARQAEKAALTKDWPEARRQITLAIETYDTSYLPAYVIRARLHFWDGEYEKALQDANRVLIKAEGHPAALWVRAKVHIAMASWEKALEDLGLLIRLEPLEPRNYLARGNVHLKTGDYAGAEFDFAKVAELATPPGSSDYVRQACVHICQQDWTAAAEHLTQAIRLAGSPMALLLRGRVYLCSRDWNHGVQDFEAALKFRLKDSTVEEALCEARTPHNPMPMLDSDSLLALKSK